METDDRSEAKAVVSLGFLLQCKSYSNCAPVQRARHAVWETLYSRAHRIGFDGVSYLLDGLRKSISFDFFVVVIVCVLICPALELVILTEQQLEGLGDDIGRRSVNELSVEF